MFWFSNVQIFQGDSKIFRSFGNFLFVLLCFPHFLLRSGNTARTCHLEMFFVETGGYFFLTSCVVAFNNDHPQNVIIFFQCMEDSVLSVLEILRFSTCFIMSHLVSVSQKSIISAAV